MSEEVISALLVLSVIVLFHEFGHFLLAKLNGIGVVEFSLGFGPRLLSWRSKKSGTRYSWKLIPFGGSCAMYGEFGDEDEDDSDEPSKEDEIMKEFADGKHGASFFTKSPLARISVVAAGPIFNFILAFLFSIVIIAWAGYDDPVVVAVTEGNAAQMAGIQSGDVITKIGNRSVMVRRDVILYMTVHSNEDLAVEYQRFDEETGTWKTYQSVMDSQYYYYQDGRYLSGMNFSGYRTQPASLYELLKYSAAEVRYSIYSVIDSLGQMAQGQVKADDIAGPIRIVTIIDETVEQVTPYGMVTVIMNVLNLMIMFSANLGVMNLLPFPALDGGRLVFLIWELITRRPVNQKIENAVTMAGMALLMAFMVFVVWNDLTFLL